MRYYVALIHKDAESDYGVSFPDPGCVTAGTSLDDAFEMAAEVLAGHVATMVDEDLPIPAPSNVETIMVDATHRDGVAVLVPLPDHGEVRVDVTLPTDLLKRIDETASDRSRFLAEAAERELERR